MEVSNRIMLCALAFLFAATAPGNAGSLQALLSTGESVAESSHKISSHSGPAVSADESTSVPGLPGEPLLLEDEESDDEKGFSGAEASACGGLKLALLSEFLSRLKESAAPETRKIPLYVLNCSWKHFLTR